jgi:hypothetical protein
MPSPTNDPLRPLEHIGFTVPFNMSEQPAASINCGYTACPSACRLPAHRACCRCRGRLQRFDDLGVLQPRHLAAARQPGAVRLCGRLHCREARAAALAPGDVPYLHGMLAFAWEQCHLLPQAEAAARHAIRLRRKEPWAHHALAHVMLTQGRIREGQAFMADVSDTWTGLNSFMVTHNWWHQALFALELDDHAEALRLYDTQVWGVVKEYSQDQINAVSLLARLELAGVDVGERWHDVATTWPRACKTMCCRFWTCSTCTAWRVPAGPRPTPCWAPSWPMPHRPPTHSAPPGNRWPYPPRRRFWPMRAATGRRPWPAWRLPCPGWWPSAAATPSATCLPRSTSTHCAAAASSAARSTCYGRRRTASRSRGGWGGWQA